MKGERFVKDVAMGDFWKARVEFQKWAPLFQRTGLKPRRFLMDTEAVYVGTASGWFRLGFQKYNRPELQWIRSVLEHLEERSFKNWAVPWPKTIVWGENNDCYLIQPWIMTGEYFQAADPGAVQRTAEIMADFYRCGKDYVQTKGLDIIRDRWSNIESEWELALSELDNFKYDELPEKIRGDVNELRKITGTLLKESLAGWRNSGMKSLLEHQRQTGILGHGRLLARNIIWREDDYYLLNWEALAFQPRILDLVVLITDAAYWEADWILYFINEFSRVQPFWPEEYCALQALLKYPKEGLMVLEKIRTGELDRKLVKEAAKELVRKERCLGKVWRELGTEKRWSGNFTVNNAQLDLNKLSMVLAPLENWGDFQGSIETTVISVKNDHKLPAEVIERLSDFDRDRIVGGKDGDIPKGAAASYIEQPARPVEIEIQAPAESKAEVPPPAPKSAGNIQRPEAVIHWTEFPKG